MHIERKKDLSVYYWLVDLFSDVPYVTISDGYPPTEIVPPTIAVDWRHIVLDPWELGNSQPVFDRAWYIDIIAKNKSQRDDFGYRILDALKTNIPVYDYDMGFPPDVSPTQLGCLIPDNVRLEEVRILPQLTQVLYYRAIVSFGAQLNKLI